jgi:hypothetical protein
LDRFISAIPSFEGDISIPPVPVLTRLLGGKSVCDPSTEASAGTSKTRAGKQKATANPTAKKKGKKAAGKSSGGIKINEPSPEVSTQIHHWVLRRGSQSITQKGMLVTNIFILA